MKISTGSKLNTMKIINVLGHSLGWERHEQKKSDLFYINENMYTSLVNIKKYLLNFCKRVKGCSLENIESTQK